MFLNISHSLSFNFLPNTSANSDVLNFQRLSDGKVALTMLPFCPMEFLTNMAHSLSIVLGSKKIEFLTHVDPRLAAFFCEGDKHRIQQVWLVFTGVVYNGTCIHFMACTLSSIRWYRILSAMLPSLPRSVAKLR